MADHQSLGIEARALLDVLAERLATVSRAESAGAEAGPADQHPARCTGCPLCATLTYLHDHRELSAQLAQGALLIVGAVRQYLDHPVPTPPTPSSSPPPDPSQASVQRIDIT